MIPLHRLNLHYRCRFWSTPCARGVAEFKARVAKAKKQQENKPAGDWSKKQDVDEKISKALWKKNEWPEKAEKAPWKGKVRSRSASPAPSEVAGAAKID